MGLTVYVYRSGEQDFSLGGISSKYHELVVVNLPGYSKPSDHAAPVLLIEHPAGKHYGHLIVPAVEGDGTDEWEQLKVPGTSRMFGGAFASSHDARWSEATAGPERVTGQPVSIHDRFEG